MRKDVQDRFTEVFVGGEWSVDGTLDGLGSGLTYTETIRNTLPPLLKKWNIKSMLDASCGQFHWMRHVDLGDIRYIGGDIVEQKIEINRAAFPDKEWMVLDIIEDTLPKVDLWMCRDTIFHFPWEAVKATFKNFVRSDIKYLLVSHHPDLDNKDIFFSDFNNLSLTKLPFNFPEPLDMIDDSGSNYHIKRFMYLYAREDMAKFQYLED